MRGRLALTGAVLIALGLAACGRQAPLTNASGEYYTPKKRGAAVLSGGAGYRGAYLEGGTGMGSPMAENAAPPAPAAAKAKPAVRAKAAKGKLPLPTQYPLLPGDEALWPTLTLEQQQRALLYLQDGSTIRASLRTD